MFEHYELKNDKLLPPQAFYEEVRDGEIIKVLPNESLEQFTNRVMSRRAEKGYPRLNPKDTKFLIMASLEHSVSKDVLLKYFDRVAIAPTLAQAAQAAKAIVRQTGRNLANYNKRQIRANKCLSCPLHKPNNQLSIAASRAMSTVLHRVSNSDPHESLAELQMSDTEKKLGQCGMCGCDLKNKIKIGELAMVADIGVDQLDRLIRICGKNAFDICWILNESLQTVEIRKILEAKLSRGLAGGRRELIAYIRDKHLEAAAKKVNDGK